MIIFLVLKALQNLRVIQQKLFMPKSNLKYTFFGGGGGGGAISNVIIHCWTVTNYALQPWQEPTHVKTATHPSFFFVSLSLSPMSHDPKNDQKSPMWLENLRLSHFLSKPSNSATDQMQTNQLNHAFNTGNIYYSITIASVSNDCQNTWHNQSPALSCKVTMLLQWHTTKQYHIGFPFIFSFLRERIWPNNSSW